MPQPGHVATSWGLHSWFCPSGPWQDRAGCHQLRDLLVGIIVENEAGGGEISELKQVEGEASCSSCKGKLIFFYECNISLSWKGKGGGVVGGAQGTARGLEAALGQSWLTYYSFI